MTRKWTPDTGADRPPLTGLAIDQPHPGPWPVLVVDDDPAVHQWCAEVLRDIRFRDRPVDLIPAHGAAEARRILESGRTVALALVNVALESADAGLQLARHVRTGLGHRAVRLILWGLEGAGMSGTRAVLDEDIDGYVLKDRTTAARLVPLVVASLRAWDDLVALEHHRAGLQRILEVTDTLLRIRSLQEYAAGVLIHLGALVQDAAGGLIAWRVPEESPEVIVLAAAPDFGAGFGTPLARAILPVGADDDVRAALERRDHVRAEGHLVLYLGSEDGPAVAALLAGPPPADVLVADLLDLFAARIGIGFANLALYEQVIRSNAELEARVAERTREIEAARRRLEVMATTDSLTGVANRRGFLDRVAEERLRAGRYGAPFGLLLLDIDHFKRINDQWGHPVGDAVLTELVRRLGRDLRAADLLGRLGGEEFGVLVPETAPAGCIDLAERLRADLAATPLDVEGRRIPVTISVGVVTGTGAEDIETLLHRVDRALYQAKEGGRDRVVIAGEED